ncbi:TPA: hypothetical protein ACSP2A_000698 [Aeromonas hydrophila]
MNYIFFVSIFLLSSNVLADSTINVYADITNQDVSSWLGSHGSAEWQPENGMIFVVDGYVSFKDYDIRLVGSSEGHYVRTYSLFNINLVGQNTGKQFSLKSSFAGGRINMNEEPLPGGWPNTAYDNGCGWVSPRNVSNQSYSVIKMDTPSVDTECTAATVQLAYRDKKPFLINGDHRQIAIDIGHFMNSKEYNELPVDIYRGTVTYNGDRWVSRTGGFYAPNQVINLIINKKPYFSGIAISNNQIPFTVKNINESHGISVLGNASVSFNLLGAFSSREKIKIDVASANNYRLTSAGGSTIPYSVDLAFRGVRSPLVLQGNKQPPVIIEPGMMGSAVTGQLMFNFKTPANLVHNGLFTDNLTLIAELVL